MQTICLKGKRETVSVMKASWLLDEGRVSREMSTGKGMVIVTLYDWNVKLNSQQLFKLCYLIKRN